MEGAGYTTEQPPPCCMPREYKHEQGPTQLWAESQGEGWP